MGRVSERGLSVQYMGDRGWLRRWRTAIVKRWLADEKGDMTGRLELYLWWYLTDTILLNFSITSACWSDW